VSEEEWDDLAEFASHFRLIWWMQDKRREREERLESMRRQRIEARAKIERGLEEERFREERLLAIAHRARLQSDAGGASSARRDVERVKRTSFEPRAIDLERLKRTSFEARPELLDLERLKRTVCDARPRDPERTKQTMTDKTDLNRIEHGAHLGEAAEILAALRLEHARLVERSAELDDGAQRARVALERAERDAARAKEELARKAERIAQLEQLLGLFHDA
jgi:hypothetical protein